MGLLRFPSGLLVAALLLPALVSVLTPPAAEAGPVIRRAQERRACQEFAGKLQRASANPAMAQQVYQQGVLALVSRFGENPCADIPPPTATGPAPAAPGAAASTAPATSPTAAAPARTAAAPASAPPATAPTGSATPASSSGNASGAGATPSAQQQQACQQFASRLQSAAASGGASAARQTYTMGLQKLSGLFGPNPCPSVKPPQ